MYSDSDAVHKAEIEVALCVHTIRQILVASKFFCRIGYLRVSNTTALCTTNKRFSPPEIPIGRDLIQVA